MRGFEARGASLVRDGRHPPHVEGRGRCTMALGPHKACPLFTYPRKLAQKGSNNQLGESCGARTTNHDRKWSETDTSHAPEQQHSEAHHARSGTPLYASPRPASSAATRHAVSFSSNQHIACRRSSPGFAYVTHRRLEPRPRRGVLLAIATWQSVRVVGHGHAARHGGPANSRHRV